MALSMLLVDRKNEFRELAHTIFANKTPSDIVNEWEKVILNFCLDVSTTFKTWTGSEPLQTTSAMKALTILRQLGREKKSMNQLAHVLNLSYDLAEEFKVIYKRIN